jgi:4-amino-4-deoxy-L-arabinose transferase-like glycosyltransferase
MSSWSERRTADVAWAVVVGLLLIVGLRLVGDFGLSWDEPDNSAFGRQALQAYVTLRPPEEWQSNLESKGPFFVALAEAFSRSVAAVRQGVSEIDTRHYAYFLTLPMAASALYSLSLRMVRPWAAFAAALLFVTQPLIFGHAFINPKDAPFMAFFLLAMAMGVWMVEAQAAPATRRRPWLTGIVLPAAAGVILGLATSIRLFGPFAGLLVTIFAGWRLRGRAARPLIPYWASAAVATFLTWPYLWGDPWGRFWESLRVLSDFPWGNLVLYRGLVYPVQELPWHYLPFVTFIQLTEPAILLALAGGILAVAGAIREPQRRPLYTVCLLWAAVPFGAALLTDTEVYDNSRQFLFALPPIFLAAGLAFDGLLSRIRRAALQAAVIVLAVVPGIAGIVQLHPYPYIYYNQLVGGVRGAFRQYELDYWATSYREAMERLNDLAAPGEVVEVAGPWLSAAAFARPDLVVFKSGEADSEMPADYFMTLTRSNMDQWTASGEEVIVEVVVDGAKLAVVRRLEGVP